MLQEQESTLATKSDLADLRADFEGLRADVRIEIEGVRTEMQTLRADVFHEIGDLKGAIGRVEGELRIIRRLFYIVCGGILALLLKDVITDTIVKLAQP